MDICKYKTAIALNANVIQAYDAELARVLVLKCDVWPVHDSFAVGLYELHHMQEAACNYFSSKLGQECDSMFILI
jgi:hypothetical protein